MAYLPLFFTYIGGFSEYLNYLTDQLVPLLANPNFSFLIQDSKEKIFTVNLKLAFIFEDVLALVPTTSYPNTSDLDQNQRGAIEKDLLPRYIFLCQMEFNQLLKKEEFLIMRVGVEKLILSTLPLMPERIDSPISVFFKLTGKYKDFPELLYLISEHFPTLAVQKMLFSGYMKNS